MSPPFRIFLAVLLVGASIGGIWFIARKSDGKLPTPARSARTFGMVDTELLPFSDTQKARLPVASAADGSPLSILAVAGSYTQRIGEGGASLAIDRQGHWDCTWMGCIPPGSHSRGVVTVADGNLVFESVSAVGVLTGKSCVCVPVWWNRGILLLTLQDLVSLCNFVNWGGPEFRRNASSFFFVCERPDDGSEPDTGGLSLPHPITSWILREPVRAQLTEVKADGSAVADFGASRGAFVGMNIDIAQDEIGIATFHVTSVTDDSCTVVCPNPEHLAGPLRVGLRLWCDAKGAGLIK